METESWSRRMLWFHNQYMLQKLDYFYKPGYICTNQCFKKNAMCGQLVYATPAALILGVCVSQKNAMCGRPNNSSGTVVFTWPCMLRRKFSVDNQYKLQKRRYFRNYVFEEECSVWTSCMCFRICCISVECQDECCVCTTSISYRTFVYPLRAQKNTLRGQPV